MTLKREQLAAACRANDDEATSPDAIGDMLERHGLDSHDAVYVAEQRAIRAAVLMFGTDDDKRKLAAKTSTRVPIRCPDKVFNQLIALHLDGMLTAARALRDQPPPKVGWGQH